MGANDDEGYSIILDGMDLVIAGWTNSYAPQPAQGPNKANVFVWKTNLMTNFDIYGKVYGWADEDEKLMDEQGLIKTNDGNYTIAGWTCSQGPGAPPNPNFLLIKIHNPTGNVIWSRVHPSVPGANSEQAYPIIQTANNGYAVAGWTNSFGIAQSEDFHFLTLDQNGSRPVCVLSINPDTGRFFGTEPDSAVCFYEGFDTTHIPIKDTSVLYTRICTTSVHIDTLDVGPTKIFFSSASPFDSTITGTITPSCSLYNYGNASVTGYNVQLTIDDFYNATYTVGVNHASHTYIQADFPASSSNWPRGEHTVKCTTQLTNDADHSNDLAESELFVNVHDVGTVLINYPTGNVDSVATLTPRAKLKNYGNVLDSFPVKFVIDGPVKTVWSNETIVRIYPGYELTLDFANWTVGPRGNYLTQCSTKLSTDMN
ncbi:MAG: hypothetical protein N2748_02290, partial [candidate division WOR-3 bacterium]|nr:hypothetical protein [candidate division WOR-3 bacterium]